MYFIAGVPPPPAIYIYQLSGVEKPDEISNFVSRTPKFTPIGRYLQTQGIKKKTGR
jgi:hypothetical protein